MGDSDKTPESNAMDIVSIAFSDVSGNGDLMEVVTAVSDPVADGQATANEDGEHTVHCVEESQVEEVAIQGDTDQPSQIEIPLPHNAIITVNDQGEQIIEFPQVVTQDPDENCVIIEQPDQTCQTATSDVQTGSQGDGALAHISQGGNGLETITFHDQGVVDEPCVVPVTISLTDVQKIQEAVSAVPDNIIPNARTNQVPHGHVVTTGISGLSANSLLGSFANIIHTSTVLSNSINVSQTSSSAFASPASASTTNTSKTPIGSVISSSPTTAAQFIHNGTNLQQINLSDAVLPQTSLSQSVLNNLQPVSGSRSVLNANSVVNLTQSQKTDSTALGNRSVFSPMTLTIRTPPGSPAVNQTLINSIVNNTEVQALLKRNPGQPITIVRVPEDPYEKRNRLGLNAKIITTNSSTFNTPNRPGRPRKDVNVLGNNSAAKTFAGKKRRRQPGTKLPKKEVEYVPPPGWKPVKSRTRSGRISRPPLYRTENFRTLPLADRQDSQVSDDEELSDLEPAETSPVSTTQGGRLKNFKCQSCSKAYIGRAGLARHLIAEPLHGSIEEYEQSEPTSSKADLSAVDDVPDKPDDQTNSDAADDRLLEDSKSPATGPPSPDKQPEVEMDTNESAKEDMSNLPSKRRRGRPPRDTNFRPAMTESMLNIRKKEKQKESLRNTLGFLSNEDLMDVCLPRLASTLSPWEFLLSKAEMTKDNSSEVLKVLQLFEELVSEVREMALNCLEKADDNEQDTEGIFLDEDDDLARVLDFEKGWYKVSEPPPGATDVPFRYKLLEAEGIASTLKRTVEIISKDDVKESEEEPEMKKMKLERDQASPQKPEASPRGGLSNLKSVSDHANEEGNVDSQSSERAGKPEMEEGAQAKSDQLETTSPSSKTNQESEASLVRATIAPGAQPSDTEIPMDQERPPGTESPTEHNQASGSVETSPQAQSSTIETPLDSEQHATTEETGESSGGKQWVEEGVAVPAEGVVVPSEDMAVPCEIGVEFVQRAEELSTIVSSADNDQGEMKDAHQPEQTHQEETSVVVPEGSTIMQMQDGTFLVQRPDGTAMQIHTPEGMTIETVQELLSMEVGQG